MSEDSRKNRDDGHEHCTYCGAIWDDRAGCRFWYIDGELFCEWCTAYEADAILGGLKALHPEWEW